MSLLAAVLVIALLGAFSSSNTTTPGTSALALDAGPLANVHASFTEEIGCVACHAEHERNGFDWVRAAFSSHDQSGQCLKCHSFDGDDRAAHNTLYPDRPEVQGPTCAACHSEHRGGNYNIANVADVVCANCHSTDITHFNHEHPAFANAFPYENPSNVNFDHAKHLETYFDPNSKWVKQPTRDAEFAKAARDSCVVCHAIDTAKREVTPKPFEATCSKCHAHQIAERPLMLFIPDELTPLLKLAMALESEEDEEVIEERTQHFLSMLQDEGVDGLAEMLNERRETDKPRMMLEGMNTSLVKEAASGWLSEDEAFEGPEWAEIDTGGWRAGEDEEGNESLRYVARRHDDPVVRSWVSYIQELSADNDATANEALAYLLDDTLGAGACGKCHRAGLLRATSGTLSDSSKQWRLGGPAQRPHTRYLHGPHLSLLGPGSSCVTCHTINRDADYAAFFEDPTDTSAYQSNFHPIAKAVCEKCHAPERVSNACLTCHQYHRKPGFRSGFEALGKEQRQASSQANARRGNT